jgi:hypothetical protein
MSQWVVVTEEQVPQVCGPYRSWSRVKGVYDDMRALDLPVHIVETSRWWEIKTDSAGHTVEDLLREF